MSQALSPIRGATTIGRGTTIVAALLLGILAAGACAKADDVVTGQPATARTSLAAANPRDSTLAADVRAATAGSDVPTTAPATTRPPSTTPTTTSAPPLSGVSTSTARATSTTAAPPATETTIRSGPDPATAAFCDRNARATSDFENLDPTKDFGNYLAMLRRVTAELAALAPGSIKADVQTVADAFAAVRTAEQIDAMTTDPKVKAASDRVTAWAEKNCPEP